MIRPATATVLLAALTSFTLAGCQTIREKPGKETRLYTEDQVVHLMRHPKYWNGRTFWMIIYPYDIEQEKFYRVCFELCDGNYANRSPFAIFAKDNRFQGLRGNKPEVVKVSYDGRCFFGKSICADTLFGFFREVD
jgi:hypothetical protein